MDLKEIAKKNDDASTSEAWRSTMIPILLEAVEKAVELVKIAPPMSEASYVGFNAMRTCWIPLETANKYNELLKGLQAHFAERRAGE